MNLIKLLESQNQNVHVNDSKNDRGAQKDPHENIGFGYIGFDALNYIVHHDSFKDIPKILENTLCW